MSDARTLLKAKRQEVRVNHPLAAYSSSGQLRCVACGTNVKHASSWEGHIGSKAHRVNAARIREAQHKEAETDKRNQSGKRNTEPGEEESKGETATKRRKIDATTLHDGSATTSTTGGPAVLPANFFSDPSKAPVWPESDDEDERDSMTAAAHPSATTPGTSSAADPSAIEEEWTRFQQTVLDLPDRQDTYERATVYAEPVLAAEVPEGFPSGEDTDGLTVAIEAPRTEDKIRRQKELEERELIMDRLMEEERAQEEADAKVLMLKQRLDTLRRLRAAKQAIRAHLTDT